MLRISTSPIGQVWKLSGKFLDSFQIFLDNSQEEYRKFQCFLRQFPDESRQIPDNVQNSPESVHNEPGLFDLNKKFKAAIALAGISKTVFYQRKNALGIKSIRQGKKGYIQVREAKAIREYGTGLATLNNGRITQEKTGKVKTITRVNPNRIKQKARTLIIEDLIAQILGELLTANPELLSKEDRTEIELYRSHLEETFPKKKFSPEEITNFVIPLHKNPTEK